MRSLSTIYTSFLQNRTENRTGRKRKKCVTLRRTSRKNVIAYLNRLMFRAQASNSMSNNKTNMCDQTENRSDCVLLNYVTKCV